MMILENVDDIQRKSLIGTSLLLPTAEKYKNVTPEKFQQRKAMKAGESSNPLDMLDCECFFKNYLHQLYLEVVLSWTSATYNTLCLAVHFYE